MTRTRQATGADAGAASAHRHELLIGPFLPQVAAGRSRLTRSARTNDLTLRTKDTQATADDRRRLHGTTYGISSRPLTGAAVRSPRVDHLRRRRDRTDVSRAGPTLERPWMAAVLSLWFPSASGRPRSTSYSRGRSGSGPLDVVRADGEVHVHRIDDGPRCYNQLQDQRDRPASHRASATVRTPRSRRCRTRHRAGGDTSRRHADHRPGSGQLTPHSAREMQLLTGCLAARVDLHASGRCQVAYLPIPART